MYSLQDYVIKFISYLQQFGGFLLGTTVSSTNKTDLHDITEILLKVVLNTIIKQPTTVTNKYDVRESKILLLKHVCSLGKILQSIC